MKISGESFLQVKVIPNSSQNKIAGKFLDEKNQEYLKVNITAVAEGGKANAALIKFLAKEFKISKSKIEIIRGETSRIKLLKIFGEFDFSKI
jgi:uncharacterized protein (TIGR00251 family)